MRIALLHLDVCNGPEAENTDKILYALKEAAANGAQWVVTPETALQGYFFNDGTKPAVINTQPGPAATVLKEAAAQHGVTLFLCCAERDGETGLDHNSCLVIGPNGALQGRHRKMHTHGVGAEAYITTGKSAEPVSCGEIKAGVLICADVWYSQRSVELKEKGAQIIIAPAAWPPGPCGPADSWEKSSLAAGVPLCLCNQTGKHAVMDMATAESAVVVNGQKVHVYSGESPAALLFDWDFEEKKLMTEHFHVIPLTTTNRSTG